MRLVRIYTSDPGSNRIQIQCTTYKKTYYAHFLTPRQRNSASQCLWTVNVWRGPMICLSIFIPADFRVQMCYRRHEDTEHVVVCFKYTCYELSLPEYINNRWILRFTVSWPVAPILGLHEPQQQSVNPAWQFTLTSIGQVAQNWFEEHFNDFLH